MAILAGRLLCAVLVGAAAAGWGLAAGGCGLFGGDANDDAVDDSDDGVGEDDGDMPSDARMEGMLAAHNTVRAQAEPPPDPPLPALVWSEELAAAAQAWADRCIMNHDPSLNELQQGENLAANTATDQFTAQDVVDLWAAEATYYDYASNGCDDVCGHYTQLVWRDTAAVGCAVRICPDGLEQWPQGREIWVCRYSPPGNWVGQRPY